MIHETMLLLQRLMIPDSNVLGKLVHDSNVRPVDHFKWWVYLQPLGQLGHGHRSGPVINWHIQVALSTEATCMVSTPW